MTAACLQSHQRALITLDTGNSKVKVAITTNKYIFRLTHSLPSIQRTVLTLNTGSSKVCTPTCYELVFVLMLDVFWRCAQLQLISGQVSESTEEGSGMRNMAYTYRHMYTHACIRHAFIRIHINTNACTLLSCMLEFGGVRIYCLRHLEVSVISD